MGQQLYKKSALVLKGIRGILESGELPSHHPLKTIFSIESHDPLSGSTYERK